MACHLVSAVCHTVWLLQFFNPFISAWMATHVESFDVVLTWRFSYFLNNPFTSLMLFEEVHMCSDARQLLCPPYMWDISQADLLYVKRHTWSLDLVGLRRDPMSVVSAAGHWHVDTILSHRNVSKSNIYIFFSLEAQLQCANVHQLRSFVMCNLTWWIQYFLPSPPWKLGYRWADLQAAQWEASLSRSRAHNHYNWNLCFVLPPTRLKGNRSEAAERRSLRAALLVIRSWYPQWCHKGSLFFRTVYPCRACFLLVFTHPFTLSSRDLFEKKILCCF